MTREQAEAKLRLIEIERERLTLQQEQEPEPELEGAEYGEGLAQQAGQGLSLGMLDELVSGGIASIDKARQWAGADIPERDWSEVFDEAMGSQEMKRKRFEQEHPGTAIAANLAGGLATGGASLSAIKGLNKLRGLGGATARMGVGGAEGALAGYAGADRDMREVGAGTGAMLGALIPGGATAGRKALELASNRRIGTELIDEAGQFTPISAVGDEGVSRLGKAIQRGYNKIVKPSMGGMVLREQGFDALDREAAKVASAKGALVETADNAKNIKVQAGQEADLGLAKLRDDADVAADQLKVNTRNAQREATDVSDQAFLGQQKQFRAQALGRSLPQGISDVETQLVNTLAPKEANAKLQEIWAREGFKEAKGQSYDLDPSVLINDALSGVDNAALAPFKAEIRKTLNTALKGKVQRPMLEPTTKFVTTGTAGQAKKARRRRATTGTGQVSGTDLMQARNELKMAASRLGEDGKPALNSGALRKAADSIDDFIKKNLPDDGARGRWDQEMEAYGMGKTYQRAVENATRKRQGEFTEDDWISATQRYSKRGAGRGQGQLQGQAEQMQDAGVERLKALKDQKEQIGRDAEVTQLQQKQAKNEAADRLRGLKRTGGDNYQGALQEQAVAKGQVAEAQESMNQMGRMVLPGSDPAAMQAHYTTKLLNKPLRSLMPGMPTAGSGMLDLATGGAAALGLSIPGVQRTFAGQTGPQKRLAKALRTRSPESEKRLRDLLRGLTRGGITAGF